MDLLAKIKLDLETIFKDNKQRLNHIYGVNELAISLAKRLGYDEYKASLAALLHDIHKYLSKEEQISYLDSENLKEIDCDSLYHAYSASVYAKKHYEINDLDVIIAIRSHVYGNLEMSLLDKIILVSDFCEKNRTYKYCVETREVLKTDFNKAVSMTLDLTIKSLYERNLTPTKKQLEINRKYGELNG